MAHQRGHKRHKKGIPQDRLEALQQIGFQFSLWTYYKGDDQNIETEDNVYDGERNGKEEGTDGGDSVARAPSRIPAATSLRIEPQQSPPPNSTRKNRKGSRIPWLRNNAMKELNQARKQRMDLEEERIKLEERISNLQDLEDQYQDKIESWTECCFCHTNLKTVLVQPCGHVSFCDACRTRAKNICPTCGLPFYNYSSHTGDVNDVEVDHTAII